MQSTPTTQTTRRAVLSGAAAVASTSAVAAPTDSGDDAELLALGRELDLVLGRWSELARTEDANQAELERVIFRATGIRFQDAPESRPIHGRPDGHFDEDPYWQTRGEIVRKSAWLSDDEYENALDKISDQAFPLSRIIVAMPARSLAGLAVKARALQFLKADTWRSARDENDDPDDVGAARFYDEVCALAGVRSLSAEAGVWDINEI